MLQEKYFQLFTPIKALNITISWVTFIYAVGYCLVMDKTDEIKTLLFMDKTPEEIITLGYPKQLVLSIFEKEFINRLEEAGIDYFESN
jgi:hypothetical protein